MVGEVYEIEGFVGYVEKEVVTAAAAAEFRLRKGKNFVLFVEGNWERVVLGKLVSLRVRLAGCVCLGELILEAFRRRGTVV